MESVVALTLLMNKKLDFLLVSLLEVHVSLSESSINSVDGEISVHPQMLRSKMFSMLIITLLVHICLVANSSTVGKVRQNASTDNSSKDKPPRVMHQTFKINNWGFDNSDRQLLFELKQKIDSLHRQNGKCNRGNDIYCLRKNESFGTLTISFWFALG